MLELLKTNTAAQATEVPLPHLKRRMSKIPTAG